MDVFEHLIDGEDQVAPGRWCKNRRVVGKAPALRAGQRRKISGDP